MRTHIYHLTDRLQTYVYVALMLVVLAGMGWILFGPEGAIMAGLVPIVLTGWVPQMPVQTLMRFKRAHPMSRWVYPQLQQLVRELSIKAELDHLPRLYLQNTNAVNAFTVGDRHTASIAISKGVIENLSLRELSGVLAHEISHIASADTRLVMFAELLRSATSTLSFMGLLLCVFIGLTVPDVIVPIWLPIAFALAPSAISLLQLALSRRREYAADAYAARLTGDPVGLAQALEHIERMEYGLWSRVFGIALPPVRNPLMSTHPPTQDRVQRLMSMVHEPRQNLQRVVRVPQPHIVYLRRPGWRVF